MINIDVIDPAAMRFSSFLLRFYLLGFLKVLLGVLQMAEVFNPGILLDIVDDEWLMDKLPNDGTYDGFMHLKNLYMSFRSLLVVELIMRRNLTLLLIYNRCAISCGCHSSS